MKKIMIILNFIAVCLLAGCGQADINVIEIREKMFIQQCNDIYINPREYNGKTVQLEGIYNEFQIDGKDAQLIYRRSPGCCGDDGMMGFLFTHSGEKPKVNDWIKVSGIIEVTNHNVKLNVSRLEVLKQRGAEFVTN